MFSLPLFAYLLCLDVKDANLRVRSLIAKYIFVFRTISTTRGTTYETTLVTAIVTWSWKEENQIRWNDETFNICFHKCIELQAPGTKVIRVESDNFGDPLIQKFLQTWRSDNFRMTLWCLKFSKKQPKNLKDFSPRI